MFNVFGDVQVETLNLNSESELVEMLSTASQDFAVISWPNLLSRKAIEAGPGKIIGSHPTTLPFGKGPSLPKPEIAA